MPPSDKDRLKIVVRNLPPLLQEEQFRAAVSKAYQGPEAWLRFTPGKVSTRQARSGFAFLAFQDQAELIRCSTALNGLPFISERGSQYRATIEYAPCQKVPRQRSKQDSREGTIEADADYQAFTEAAQAPQQQRFVPAPAAAESQSMAETALVRALKLRREGQSAPKPRRPSNAQADASMPPGMTQPRKGKAGKARVGRDAPPVSEAPPAPAAETSVPRDTKPVRMRAGFSVYQPGQRKPDAASAAPPAPSAGEGLATEMLPTPASGQTSEAKAPTVEGRQNPEAKGRSRGARQKHRPADGLSSEGWMPQDAGVQSRGMKPDEAASGAVSASGGLVQVPLEDRQPSAIEGRPSTAGRGRHRSRHKS